MSDTGKTKTQLIDELAAIRQRLAELEASETERKRLDAELRLKENALENSLSAVAMSDMEGKITYVNQACLDLWGSDSKEELLGKPYWVLSFSEGKVKEIATAMLERGKWTGEVAGTRKDGGELHLQVFSAVIRDDKGSPAQTVSSFIDVTESKRMQEALRESEELSRGMLETAATGMYLLQDGRLQYVNPTFEQMSGYSKEELLGKTSLDYVHPDDREEAREKAIQVLKGQRILPYEFRFVRKDSKTVWLLDWVTSIQYKGSRAVLGALTDVTERKRAEEELRQYRDHLERLVEERTAELTKTQETATRQAQEIIEISTPIIQLRRGILLAPLIGSLASERAQQFTERLLTAIAHTNSTVALVDITGVPTVDTQTAHHITRTISAVRLLGAQAILTGVGPALASTLVELGIDLSSVITRSSLAAGLEDAMNLLKARG